MGMAMFQITCLGSIGRSHSWLRSHFLETSFPFETMGQEEPSALAVCCSSGILHTLYLLCSGSYQLHPPPSWLEYCGAAQLPCILARHTGQMEPGDTVPGGRGGWGDMTPRFGTDKPGSRVSNTPCVSTQIRQICPSVSSLVRVCPRLVSGDDDQSYWLGLLLRLLLYLGCCSQKLHLPRSVCWLLQATLPSLSLSDSCGRTPRFPLQF